MRASFLNHQKIKLINFINRYSAHVYRYRFFIIIPPFLIILLTLLPGILINLWIDKNKINKQMELISSEGNLQYSSDGIVKSWYRDIIVYNVRITDTSEHLNQQPLLTIPELRIIPNIIQSMKQKSLSIEEIIIKDARWKYIGKENYLNKSLQNKILKVLNHNGNYKIILINNIITVTFEKKNYERQVWNFLIDRGSIKSDKNKVEITLHYEDLPWGKGQLIFSPDLCDQCSLFNGKYSIDLNKFPVNRLSWFFESIKLNNGFIDLKSNFVYAYNGKNNETDLNAKIRMKDIQISDLSNHPILINPRVDFDIKYQDNNDFINTDFTGRWWKSGFKGILRKNKKSAYPETLTFSLDNTSGKSIPLLYGYKLEGLQLLDFGIQEDKTGKVYRILDGRFLTGKDGSILDLNNQLILKLPQVSLKLDDNQFSGIINLIRNKSDMKFLFSGSVIPFNKTIDTQIEFDDYNRNKQISYDGVVFEINETGELSAENLHWEDIDIYYQNIKNWWQNSIKNDQYKGWRPSIFRERDWFQKYLMRTTLNNTLVIKNWQYTENEKLVTPVNGSVMLNHAVFDLRLDNESQNCAMTIDMTNNTPIMRGEYKLLFTKLDNYSSNWIPAGLISRFGDLTMESKFTSSGEQPVDILNNFNSNGSILLHNAVIIIDDKKPSDILDNVNLEIRRYGVKYQININGENESSTINGWGSFDKEDNGWKIKTSVFPKR